MNDSHLENALMLLESHQTDEIEASDIFNFYYCTLLLNRILYPEEQDLLLYFISDLREKYLKSFHRVIIDQLEKYYDRDRLDQGSYTPEDLSGASFGILRRYMLSTYRSDMSRRNIRWNDLADNLVKLEGASSIKNITFVLDRINNNIHNTGQTVLTKLGNSRTLELAFDMAHSATPAKLRSLVHPKLRKIQLI